MCRGRGSRGHFSFSNMSYGGYGGGRGGRGRGRGRGYGGGGGGGGYRTVNDDENPTIYINGLPLDCTVQDLVEHFGAIGLIKVLFYLDMSIPIIVVVVVIVIVVFVVVFNLCRCKRIQLTNVRASRFPKLKSTRIK